MPNIKKMEAYLKTLSEDNPIHIKIRICRLGFNKKV